VHEAARVALAVVAADLLLRLVGLWSWTASSTLGRWPWLIERYAWIFPATLILAVLGVRRWRTARSSLLGAGLSGAGAGLVTGVLALALAQVVFAPEGSHFWSGLHLEGGVVGFLLFGSGLSLFRTLGWLYGSFASILAVLTERGEQYCPRSGDQARARAWLWRMLVFVLVTAVYTSNLTLFNYWASGGPPSPQPEIYEQRGNFFFELTAALLLIAVLLVINLRGKGTSKSQGAPEFGALSLLAVLMGVSCLACGSAKTAPGSYFSSLDYQARETLSQSLFREDLSVLSNEEIERILSSKIELPHDARLALLQLGADPHVLVLPAPDVNGEGDAAAVLERLAASDRLSSVVLLPSLLVPRNLSVAKLREAAARFQADLLFIYRTPCQQFRRNRFLAADEARAYCVAEGVLLDVRTGIIPFSGVASSTFGAVQEPDGLTTYETLRRSQSEAIARALSELADHLLGFLAAAP